MFLVYRCTRASSVSILGLQLFQCMQLLVSTSYLSCPSTHIGLVPANDSEFVPTMETQTTEVEGMTALIDSNHGSSVIEDYADF